MELCSKSPGLPYRVKLLEPRNLFSALSLDQISSTNPSLGYRKSYLRQHLNLCDSMYSVDIRGFEGCVNALAFSRGEEQFLATGKFATDARSYVSKRKKKGLYFKLCALVSQSVFVTL